ncbi:MAG TPA: erythromycin esterase family protein, partial [Chloroflexia bacterium]|nr:erythromycin esterase family protein [Chloroflexia bacterium]
MADGGDAASPPVSGNIATPVCILIVEYRACAEVDYTFLRGCFLRHESSPNTEFSRGGDLMNPAVRYRTTWPLVCAAIALVCLPAMLTASHPGPAYAQPGGRTFPETGKTVSGAFLAYWESNGGLAQQGYPISGEMAEVSDLDGKTYTVQYFERAVFELHPENSPPHDVLLSLLGTFEYKRRYGDAGAPGGRASADKPRFFSETGKTLGGVFREYWENHGGLAQQGYPISDEFEEKSELDGKTYTVQYFQRAVFELHPENAGTPYEVLLSQLGKFRYNRRHGGAPVSPGETPVPAASVPAEAAGWLREHAVPLRTAEPSDDYSDLLPLKELIGDARIVALGEATHGSREFFTMKHRILRFLVQEMGFTVLAFEDGWPEALSVDEYVLGGPGSPEDAVRDLLYWPWETREVVEMVEWMRAYNASRGEAPA